jgi:uncharacterized protein (TIGR00725 family)
VPDAGLPSLGGARWVGVVGPGSAVSGATPALETVAEEVGRGLAEAGAVLVCGGLGGVMAAACRGAVAAGGTTVGILPGADRSEANPWVVVPLATGLGEARNALVVRSVDVLVAVGGGWGTLSEIALALRGGRPVVGVGTWRLVPPGAEVTSGVEEVADPTAAVRRALTLAGQARV